MKLPRRTPEDWHALGQFWTQMGFVLCLVSICFGILYCLMFVTQPMSNQAPNDVVLFEILKTVLVSMISIIGTLMAVGHGSNATSLPAPPKPLPPAGVTVSTPLGDKLVKPEPSWVNRPPPSVKPKVADDDDEPVFKGAKE